MRYTFLGDKMSRSELRGMQCDPVRRQDGKCIVHIKLASALVVDANGKQYVHAICQAPSWPTVWRWLAEVIQDREVLVYNLNFDFDVITRMNWAAGLPTPDHTHWDCLMHSYAAFHGAWSEYWGSYRWQPLQGGDHSAVGDCRAALDLLRHMANAEIRE